MTLELQQGVGRVCMCLGYMCRLDICLWETDGKLGEIRCLLKTILATLHGPFDDSHHLTELKTIFWVFRLIF